MRGKVVAKTLGYVEGRITPAYAGKREAQHAAEGVTGDHPRLCGEKANTNVSMMGDTGSPPPMRGKVARKMPEWYEERITPAYAGKSPACDFCGRDTWDHPRLCGEKPVNFPASASGGGSPPPMRGKGCHK